MNPSPAKCQIRLGTLALRCPLLAYGNLYVLHAWGATLLTLGTSRKIYMTSTGQPPFFVTATL